MLIFGKRKLHELCIQAYIRPGASILGTANLFRKNRKEAS